MAVTERLFSQKATVQLNNGVTTQGHVRLLGVSIGALSEAGWDAEKAMRIFNAIGAIMDRTVYRNDRVVTYIVENS